VVSFLRKVKKHITFKIYTKGLYINKYYKVEAGGKMSTQKISKPAERRAGDSSQAGVNIEIISPEMFERAAAEKKTRGNVKKIIEQVKNDHQILKISGLRRGQVAALAKAAKAEGLKYLTFYDRGEIYLAPA